MSALTRSGRTILWDDRKILTGKYLNTEISKALHSADIMFLLISSSFIASDYCMEIEFETALERNRKGELYIVPLIVRECDFSIEPLSQMNFCPRDAKPINPSGAGPEDNTSRDGAWAAAIKEIKGVFKELDLKKSQ